MSYAQETGTPTDIGGTLRNMLDINPEGALKFAKSMW
jgi:hypothetical protein